MLNLFQKGHPGIEQVDQRALKRQRDRDNKYASLTKEQKAVRAPKAKENYHKRRVRY